MRNLARNFISSKKEIEYVLTDSYFSVKDYDIKLTHFKLSYCVELQKNIN